MCEHTTLNEMNNTNYYTAQSVPVDHIISIKTERLLFAIVYIKYEGVVILPEERSDH